MEVKHVSISTNIKKGSGPMFNGDDFPTVGVPVRRSKSGKATRIFHEDGSSEFVFARENELFEQQILAFYNKFGRMPEGDDPLLFDPLEEHPGPMSEAGIDHLVDLVLVKSGAHPSIRFAWETTGKLVTEENRGLLTPTELAEWYCVIHDWEKLNPEEKPLDAMALESDLFEEIEENLAHYRHLRTLLPANSYLGNVTLDVLHVATILMAGRAPAAAAMLTTLAYQAEERQTELFVMVAGTLIKASLEAGAFQTDPDLMDVVTGIAETFNVDSEAAQLLNNIDLAENKFTISGDPFTVVAATSSAVAGLIACDVLPEAAVISLLETEE